MNLMQSSSAISSTESLLTSFSLPTWLPFTSSQPVPFSFPMSHGTTTLVFMFQGSILTAADTCSNCSGLMACPVSQRILPIHSHLIGTTSGISADRTLWKRILSRELWLYQLRYGRWISTSGTAKLLSHMLHSFKGTELCVAEQDDGCHDSSSETQKNWSEIYCRCLQWKHLSVMESGLFFWHSQRVQRRTWVFMSPDCLYAAMVLVSRGHSSLWVQDPPMPTLSWTKEFIGVWQWRRLHQ